MYLIFGKTTDQTIIERGRRSDDVDIDKLKQAVAANNSCTPAQVAVYQLPDGSNVTARLRAGDEFVLVWTGNEITAVDFTVYDAKDRLRFNSDKSEILANGIETCKITVRLISASDADVSLNVSGIYVPVQSPLGIVTKKIDIVAGLVRFDFGTTTPGLWHFPANGVKTIGNYRVKNQEVINALVP